MPSDSPKNAPLGIIPLGIILESGTHGRAHYAFVVASGAAALGRNVVLFATNAGCLALCRDWSGLSDAKRDSVIQGRGVAGLETLREACQDLGVRMIACDAGLRAEAIDPAGLLEGVEVAGIATLLEAIGGGPFITL